MGQLPSVYWTHGVLCQFVTVLTLVIDLLTFMQASQLTTSLLVLRPLYLHELLHFLGGLCVQVVAVCLESHTVWIGERHEVSYHYTFLVASGADNRPFRNIILTVYIPCSSDVYALHNPEMGLSCTCPLLVCSVSARHEGIPC